MGNLTKLVIFGDPQKKGVIEKISQFTEFVKDKADIIGNYNIIKLHNECLHPKGPIKNKVTEIQDVLQKCDYAVVFGGDGSIICTARFVSDANVPVIGVNVGKLGFLAEFSVDDLTNLFTDIIDGKVAIEKRMMLNCCVINSKDRSEKFCAPAINDIYLTAGTLLIYPSQSKGDRQIISQKIIQ